MSLLKLGIPKGSLQDATIDLLARAGWKVSLSSRSYVPTIDDSEMECLLVRAQEMARYVESGALDAGITGHDWVVETRANVLELAELVYAKQRLSRVKWVLAVPEDSVIREPRDLEGKVIATEVVGITQAYLARPRGKIARRIFVGRDGSESAATGRRHRRSHRNRVVLASESSADSRYGLESATVFIMNPDAARDAAKREKGKILS